MVILFLLRDAGVSNMKTFRGAKFIESRSIKEQKLRQNKFRKYNEFRIPSGSASSLRTSGVSDDRGPGLRTGIVSLVTALHMSSVGALCPPFGCAEVPCGNRGASSATFRRGLSFVAFGAGVPSTRRRIVMSNASGMTSETMGSTCAGGSARRGPSSVVFAFGRSVVGRFGATPHTASRSSSSSRRRTAVRSWSRRAPGNTLAWVGQCFRMWPGFLHP